MTWQPADESFALHGLVPDVLHSVFVGTRDEYLAASTGRYDDLRA